MQKKIEKKLNLKIKFKLKKKFFSSMENLKEGTIFFSNNLNNKSIIKLKSLKNGILITNKKNFLINKNIIQIIKRDPKFFYFDLLRKIISSKNKITKPILGKGTILDKKVSVGNKVKIGKNCRIHSGVVIGDNVTIGNNCTIKSNSVIGQRGFGVLRNKNNNLVEVPHYGSVKIKDNVEIGALNTIARGTIDDTIINSYNKFDDHIHIAHNCIIGKNNIFCAGTIVGGSVKIGINNFFGLNSTIKNKITIGSNNLIGQSSNLVKPIKNNLVVYGNPARKY